MAYSYDFEDPLIYEMVERSHWPHELFYDSETARKILIRIECAHCLDEWPCAAIVALRDWQEGKPHLRVLQTGD